MIIAKRIKFAFLALLFTTVSQMAWAQNFDVWDGHSEEKPGTYGACIQIKSAAQMAWVMNHYTAEVGNQNPYRASIDICTDIDMTAGIWKPLGSELELYYKAEPWVSSVTCNGLGHTVKIRIDNGTSDNYQGLFYGIGEDGKVKNLHVDCYIKVGNARYVAGICGENEGTIENCWVSGHIESSHYSQYDADLGGIAGLNDNDGVIRYCCVTADIKNTGGNSGVGGIAGSNEGIIRHVTFYGSVDDNGHGQNNKYVGDQDGTLSNNYDSFNQGEYDDASGKDMYRYAIKYPHAINITTVGPGTYRADIGNETNVPGCYPDGTVTLTNTSGRNLSSISIKDASGNDISYSGDMNTSLNFTMPNKDVYVTAVFSSNWPSGGHAGSEGDPYLINNANDWNEFAQSVYLGNTHSGKYVKLTKDISATTTCSRLMSRVISKADLLPLRRKRRPVKRPWRVF